MFIAAITLTRGFTMHEHLDQVGLIHMGGRVYDPELGRFLSPDPFVQFPFSTQGFNRYAYVSNNPLSYTDPSGYFVKGLMKAIGIGINFVPGFQGWGGAVMRGFISGYMVTAGDPRAAAVGAMGGAMFHGIGNQYGDVGFGSAQHMQKTMAHGMAGGLLSTAGGGRFGDGFLGAAAGQAMAPAIDGIGMGSDGQIATDPGSRIARVMSAAAVGGTASTIGGGKFANGAWSAAFVSRFNHDGGFGREPMKNPLRALWEGFKMRFGGIESDMAQYSGLRDGLSDSAAAAAALGQSVVDTTSHASIAGGACAGAGYAGCFDVTVSLSSASVHLAKGSGWGIRWYLGLEYDPVQHQGLTARSVLAGGHGSVAFTASRAGHSASFILSAPPAGVFRGSTVGYTWRRDWGK